MIKGLIFDLDGVLVDTKKIHFEALNEALIKCKSKQMKFNHKLSTKKTTVKNGLWKRQLNKIPEQANNSKLSL